MQCGWWENLRDVIAGISINEFQFFSGRIFVLNSDIPRKEIPDIHPTLVSLKNLPVQKTGLPVQINCDCVW